MQIGWHFLACIFEPILGAPKEDLFPLFRLFRLFRSILARLLRNYLPLDFAVFLMANKTNHMDFLAIVPGSIVETLLFAREMYYDFLPFTRDFFQYSFIEVNILYWAMVYFLLFHFF
jgi:hypothetical protein